MRLLVAVDGSEQSDNALAHAERLAEATDGSLTPVHAVDPGVHEVADVDPIAGDRLVVEDEGEAEDRARRILEEAAASVESVPVTVELLHGDPREVVPDFAASEGYDGIVVGHRGLSERGERVLGSVAKSLVEHSPVPVTVVS
ncbi:MAG: universal stress protein UspA related nucleotide-binding protein [uncultured archaeon A07HB70]|nr:MAG: universal stress protein UspA related nucleotide-binding protein [uncultured archaeon A07HB70]